MYRLPFIGIMIGMAVLLGAQNPHGESFDTDCASCHNSSGWEIVMDTFIYNHSLTGFELEGEHYNVDCKSCHTTLIFEEAQSDCISCHTDVHEMAVGNDCVRCHTPDSWLVDNIPELHEMNGFPLTGAHGSLSCVDCHLAETNLKFDRVGNDCVSCHLEDYNLTESPNHEANGYALTCIDCHDASSFDWGTDIVDHSFFPLTLGHDIQDCKTCHVTDVFADASSDCLSCHQVDYNNTTSPDHMSLNLNTDCTACHTIDPGWRPADFEDHDAQFFPIYSGAHQGVWTDCLECHTNPDDFTQNSCINCHINPETNDAHINVGGYTYEDNACLTCHPTGDLDMVFNHDDTNFPLTGSHRDVSCIDCHSDGFQGTPTNCVDCHTNDFQGSVNPDHADLNLSTDCASCHTTDPEWMPAEFVIHDQFFPLEGAHALVASECMSCHNGDYNNTPSTCIGCHSDDYESAKEPDHKTSQIPTDCTTCHDQNAWAPSSFDHSSFYPLNGAHAAIANDCIACHTDGYINTPTTCVSCHQVDYTNTNKPDHMAAGFSTDCINCHSESAWTPATFDHDEQFFPIYSGAHLGVWSDCIECHNNPNNFSQFTCIGCHLNPETDDEHTSVGGYVYTDNACLTCHPTGDSDMSFDHDNTNFPLTGGHINVDCIDCHTNGFQGTSTNCIDCHDSEFQASINPNHAQLNLSTDCASCHTTDPEWMPALFDIHEEHFPLLGAHAAIASDCVACHNGDYVNTPNECVGCHLDDYNMTTEPDHREAQFPTDCTICHSESEWEPSSFDHNSFYPLNGAHAIIENECAQCHADGYVNTPNECVGCHLDDYNTTTEPDHREAQFPTDCTVCHSETAWEPSSFDHNSFYPLNGAHAIIENECAQCHADGYVNTPNECVGCHLDDYNTTTEPDHREAQFPTDCTVCHSETAWEPSSFDHNSFYPLNGAHAIIENECAQCHADGFVNTPTECVDCHLSDFNTARNPDHREAQFPTDCTVCHSETGWEPSSFDHTSFYPLNGAHAIIENECAQCHADGYVNTPNECVGCHLTDFNTARNPDHREAQFPTDCTVCHSETAWEPSSFDHTSFYPLNGAHAIIENECAQCHTNGFVNTPNECIGCHLSDYNNTNDPNHRAAQFPTDCLQCHIESAWEPADFNHDALYFPIYSGNHRGEWNDCTECHINSNNYGVFSCIDCHEHSDRNEVDEDHEDVGGYRFESNACLSCHPNGDE